MAVAQAAKSFLSRKSQQPITNLSLTFYMRTESIGIIHDVENAMSARGRGVVAAKFTILGEREMSSHGMGSSSCPTSTDALVPSPASRAFTWRASS